MGFETSDLGVNTPPAENEIKKPKEGLGAEKNRLIQEYVKTNNDVKILELIDQESDKQTACEVFINALKENNNPYFLKDLLDKGINGYQDAIKALVIYTYKNHLQGERFWKNPFKDEILFIDDDGELIMLNGEVSTHSQGPSAGMNYLGTGIMDKYKILTGPNKGKIFDFNERPIKGPDMSK